jgi:hypothetical protein
VRLPNLMPRRTSRVELWPGEVHTPYDGSAQAKDELKAACQIAEVDDTLLFVQIELPRKLTWLLAVGTGLTEFPDPTSEDCGQQLRREAEAEIAAIAPSLGLTARVLPPRGDPARV